MPLMLNEKEWTILSSLQQLTQPIHLEELASLHKLSPRSIRTYITRINSNFGTEVISLKKGFYQVKNPSVLEDFFKDYQITSFSAAAMVSFMLHKLVLENSINLSHFVTEFEVSRSTAKNYLNQVKEYLEEYHLTLEHSGRITLIGSEQEKRQLLLNLLLTLHEKERVELKLIQPLLLTLEDLEKSALLAHFLQSVLEKLDYTLSEHSHKILLTYMLLVLDRLEKNFPLTSIENKPFLQQSREYQETEPLFAPLEEALSLTFSLEERLEVINKIMGLHYSKNKEFEEHNWFEYDLFISQLIRHFSKECGVNLVGDFQLYESLLNHIKPAMYRIAHNLRLNQFDYLGIIEQSQEEYALTTQILEDLHFFPSAESATHYQDEIALICVYFKQAIEKNKTEEKKNILFISNYGFGSTTMMIEKIRHLFWVEQMECIPSQELKNLEQHQFQLIITTESLPDPKPLLPVVEVSPFFNQKDLLSLSEFLSPKEPPVLSLSKLLDTIEEHVTIPDKTSLQNALKAQFPTQILDDTQDSTSILNFMEKETILLDLEADTMEEVLNCAGKLLENNGYIHHSYTCDLVESFENYGVYMMIDENVAIPHTKNKGNVIKTGFSFLRLKKPVYFEGKPLSMFFTFCTVNNKEHLEALILIADVMKSQSLKTAISTLKTPEEILALLRGYENL